MVFTNIQNWDWKDFVWEIKSEKWLKNESEATVYLLWMIRRWCGDARFYKIADEWRKQKPFDVIWCFECEWWRMIAIEIKYIDNKKIDQEIVKEATLKKLEPIQVLNLTKIKMAWGQSIIIWYAEANRTFYLYNY